MTEKAADACTECEATAVCFVPVAFCHEHAREFWQAAVAFGSQMAKQYRAHPETAPKTPLLPEESVRPTVPRYTSLCKCGRKYEHVYRNARMCRECRADRNREIARTRRPRLRERLAS